MGVNKKRLYTNLFILSKIIQKSPLFSIENRGFFLNKKVYPQGIHSPTIPLYHTICQVSTPKQIFGSRFRWGTRLLPKFWQQSNQPIRSPLKELGAGAARGARPPNPPTLLLSHEELRLVKCFSKKIFFFFFLFIFPLLLYHILVAVVKYFSKTFLKKFFIFLLTFAF